MLSHLRVAVSPADAACSESVRHLVDLGARPLDDVRPDAPGPGAHTETLRVAGGDRDAEAGGGASVSVRWPLSAGAWLRAGRDGAETATQAASGLMAAHGLDGGVPRRLGLAVASAAAASLAAQGALATLVGRLRGASIRGVETSGVQAGLLFVAHQLAMATCSDRWPPPPAGAAPGPPFRTADGRLLELEAPSRQAWLAFWEALGARAAAADRAWPAFALRYNTAACLLPPELPEALGRRNLSDVLAAAQAAGIATCLVRSYEEVLRDRDWDAAGRRRGPRGGRLRTPPLWFEDSVLGRAPDGAPAPPRDAPARAPHEPARLPALRPVSPGMVRPLAGLRVLECSHGLPGPLAGHLLAELGADVTRVEPPGGDPGRRVRPLAGGLGAGFLTYNRRKHAVELDYKTDLGRAAIRDLASVSDVFLHNWLPGRAEALGLDAPDLARCNPSLVYACISGWRGAREADDRVGIEYFVQAHAGVGDGLAPEHASPEPSRLILSGVMAALLACEGILAALYRRERDPPAGHGAPRVETSLFLGAMALQREVLEAAAGGREHGRRRGRPVWGALGEPHATSDGYLVVLGGGEAAGTARDLRGRPTADWLRLLETEGVSAAPVVAQVEALPGAPGVSGMLEPAGNGTCWMPASPWQFSA